MAETSYGDHDWGGYLACTRMQPSGLGTSAGRDPQRRARDQDDSERP